MEARIKTYKDNADVYLSVKDKVFRFIKFNPGTTIHEIELRLGIKNVTIGGRISDLLDDGLIYTWDSCKVGNSTFSKYRVTPDNLIGMRKETRGKQKFLKWYNKGLKRGFFNPDKNTVNWSENTI